MAYGNRVKTDSLSTTYSNAAYELGTVYVEGPDEVAANGSGVTPVVAASLFTLLRGERTWVFIRAVGNIIAGDLVKLNGVAVPYVGARDNTDEGTKWLMLGVADHNINNNDYGWIIQKGTCVVQAQAGVAAADLLASDGNTAAGEVDTWTAGAGLSNRIVGIALEAEDAAAPTGIGFVQARINLSSGA